MRFGGYVQPQFRLREDSPAQFDEDGFRLARTRFTATAEGSTGSLDLTAYMEAELQPTFSLLDAFATVSRKLPAGGLVTLDFGQTRVPISRQQLLSDSRLAFVDKAQLATIAPDRDLGARLAFVAPHVPWIRVVGGVFNGEGRNQVENINQKYLYAGRLEVSPFGTAMPLAESSFGGDLLTAAVSVGHNSLTPGQFKEDLLYLGADLSAAWHGISGSVEYLEVRHTFSGNRPGPDYKANGWTAQLNYMLPMELPSGQGRFEVGARVEEIDRNDAVPIAQLGDPNQSVREYTAVASYYLRKHDAKIQLAASHFTEIEDRTVTSDNASYPNDQLLLQVTYRVE